MLLTSPGPLLAAEGRHALAEDPLVPHEGLLERLPLEFLESREVLPVGLADGWVQLAVADGGDLAVADDVAVLTGARVRRLPAGRQDILRALAILRRRRKQEDWCRLAGTSPDSPADVLELVSRLLQEAVDLGASDLHLGMSADAFQIRARVDGTLHLVCRLDARWHAAVVNCIKVQAALDITQRRRAQNGRFELSGKAGVQDVRVSVLPGVDGENLVLRILQRDTAFLDLEKLGMPVRERIAWTRLASSRDGLLLVTGPTGSGKTTTLHGTLRRVAHSRINTIAIEDPVEYRLPEVVHVPVRPELGFAEALRQTLRQDPDVLLVGEIRDAETARTAVEAAMTGHLVLSTLHCRSAPSALGRLLDLGVSPAGLASTLRGVLSQRLLPRLCASCATSLPPRRGAAMRRRLARLDLDLSGLRRSPGCGACRFTGTSGRLALFELLAADAPLRLRIEEGSLGSAEETGALQKQVLAAALAGRADADELKDEDLEAFMT